MRLRNLLYKLNKIKEKNIPEAVYLALFHFNPFINRLNFNEPRAQFPIFCFHYVHPEVFERQMLYLKHNNYTAISPDEIEYAIKSKVSVKDKIVLLTFDDACLSYWTTAFPILQKHQFHSLLFIAPRLISEKSQVRPQIDRHLRSRISNEYSRRSATGSNKDRYCSWKELDIMHRSGIVTFGSHSLTHSRIPISPFLFDFHNISGPEPSPSLAANANPGFYSSETTFGLSGKEYVEAVYVYASRLSKYRKMLNVPEVNNFLNSFIDSNGGKTFFTNKNWKQALYSKYKELINKRHDLFAKESQEDQKSAMYRELHLSKSALENAFHGASIQHFCYPWYQSCELSDEISFDVGYKYNFYGMFGLRSDLSRTGFFRLYRLPDYYIFSLPGIDSINILKAKYNNFKFACQRD